nr:STAS domain-containing protein [Prauserella shujinwangii]
MSTTQPAAVPAQAGTASHGMHIDAESRDGLLLARISGEIDLLSAPELRTFVEKATRDHALVLDLDGVGFLGSAGLSVLAELAEKAENGSGTGIRWAVVATRRVVLRPLEATGLDALMPVCASQEEAVAAVTTEG